MSNLAPSPQAYRQSAVLSATPGQLVVMLYDGAKRFLRQAAAAIDANEIERSHIALRRAELIVASLDGTLDFEQGPQLAARLRDIYRFCLANLNTARVSRDSSKVEEVAALLGELREAWAQVAAEVDGA